MTTSSDALVGDLTADEARRLVERGQRAILKASEAMAELREVLPPLWEGRAWVALEYESWEALCRAEFGVRLPRVDRRLLAAHLADSGMTGRAIAFGLGVDPDTIQRDLSAGNPAPKPKRQSDQVVVPFRRKNEQDPEPEPKTWLEEQMEALDHELANPRIATPGPFSAEEQARFEAHTRAKVDAQVGRWTGSVRRMAEGAPHWRAMLPDEDWQKATRELRDALHATLAALAPHSEP